MASWLLESDNCQERNFVREIAAITMNVRTAESTGAQVPNCFVS